MDNQKRLLNVALALFGQRGYEAVGVQEIVEAADLTKPTLYHYFGSKRGLLAALLAREIEPLMRAISKAAIYEGDLVQTLKALVRAYFQAAKIAPVFYLLSLAMRFSPPESETYRAILPYDRQQQDMLEGVFQRAVADHGNLHGRHQRYAVGFLGQINAAILLHFRGEWDLDHQAVYELVHQFMHGIFS